MTLAMNFIIHGEAVRFNRGKGSNDAFDFKHMKGKHEDIIPYVSSQCFKRHWREALECTKSPVSRKKNQAWTAGNPIEFIDDDLFGYMIAGAVDEEDSSSQEKILGPAEILSTKCEILEFATDRGLCR